MKVGAGEIVDGVDRFLANSAESAEKPHRATLLAELPARFVGTSAYGTQNRRNTEPQSTFRFRGESLGVSISLPALLLLGEGYSDWFELRWGYFRPRAFHTPICTPISLLKGRGSLTSGAMCPREAAMNSEK